MLVKYTGLLYMPGMMPTTNRLSLKLVRLLVIAGPRVNLYEVVVATETAKSHVKTRSGEVLLSCVFFWDIFRLRNTLFSQISMSS